MKSVKDGYLYLSDAYSIGTNKGQLLPRVPFWFGVCTKLFKGDDLVQGGILLLLMNKQQSAKLWCEAEKLSSLDTKESQYTEKAKILLISRNDSLGAIQEYKQYFKVIWLSHEE